MVTHWWTFSFQDVQSLISLLKAPLDKLYFQFLYVSDAALYEMHATFKKSNR